MDGGAWWAIVHGVRESRTRLSDCYVENGVEKGHQIPWLDNSCNIFKERLTILVKFLSVKSSDLAIPLL